MSKSKKANHFKNIHKQIGIGLLELMLALAVIALLLLMATRYYTITHRSQELNSATSDISFLVASIKTWRSSQASYATMTFGSLYKLGLIPDAFKGVDSSTGNSLNPGPMWAGCASEVVLKPANTGESVDVTFSKLNPVICEGLIQRLTKDKANWIKVNTTTCIETPCGATFEVSVTGY